MERYQRLMIAHGFLIALVGLVAGFLLLFSLIGSAEVWPGYIFPFEVYGTSEGWVRAHSGGLLNGILVVIAGLCLPKLSLSDKAMGFFAWGLIYVGWSFTLFYWAGNAASNRSLTMGNNVFGEGDWVGLLGFLPALPSVIIAPVLLYMGARAALLDGDTPSTGK